MVEANTINAGAGQLLVVGNTNGNFDTINASGMVGGGKTANGQGTGISMNVNTQAYINGTGNTIYMAGTGSTLYSSSNYIVTMTGTSETISGNGNTINLAGKSTISLNGDKNTVVGNGGTINYSGTGFLSVDGSNLTINDAGRGSYITFTKTSTNETINRSGTNSYITNIAGYTLSFNGSTYSVQYVGAASSSSSVPSVTTTINGVTCTSITSTDTSTGVTSTATVCSAPATVSNSCGSSDPIILNLQGGKVETQSRSMSAAYFDMQNNGDRVHTGWAAMGEGLLVYSQDDPDKAVTQDSQLIAGMSVLKGMDSNMDNVLNNQDDVWRDLRVWITDGTGDFHNNQLFSLYDLGIDSIGLNSQYVNQENHGNTILDESTFTWSDGRIGNIAGVDFVYDLNPSSQADNLINHMASFSSSAQITGLISENQHYFNQSSVLTVNH